MVSGRGRRGLDPGSSPSSPGWAEDARGMRCFGGEENMLPLGQHLRWYLWLPPVHPPASFASSSSGRLRLLILRLFTGGSTAGVR